MFETQVTVVGNVATPVKGWTLANGDVVAKFRLASTERRRPPSAGGGWVNGDSLFIQVTCWRQLAENVIASLGVGDPIVVRGRLYTDEFEWEGQRRSTIRLEAHAVGPDLSWCKAVVTRVRRGVVPAGPAAGAPVAEELAGGSTPAPDVWSTTAEGRAVAAAPDAVADQVDAPSDDQRERLGAPVEAGVGA
jgi:single-strand DNA-binding protein